MIYKLVKVFGRDSLEQRTANPRCAFQIMLLRLSLSKLAVQLQQQLKSDAKATV
jgi:hypothetical protein